MAWKMEYNELIFFTGATGPGSMVSHRHNVTATTSHAQRHMHNVTATTSQAQRHMHNVTRISQEYTSGITYNHALDIGEGNVAL